MKNKNLIHTLIIIALLLTPEAIQAQGKFSNAITNVDLEKSNNNSVKVNIYTKNPYNEKISVLKKGNKKYEILIPKADNWMNETPSTTRVNDYIKNINIKTQAGTSAKNKGYTKIVIESKTPVEIVPKTLQPTPKPAEPTFTGGKIIEKAVPFTPDTLNIVYKRPTIQTPIIIPPAKKPIIRASKPKPYFAPKNFPIEIIDIPQPKTVKDSEYTEDYLLITDNEDPEVQEKEKAVVDVSKATKALLKDEPKKLTIKSKLNALTSIKTTIKKLLSPQFNFKILKILLILGVVATSLWVIIFSIFKVKKLKQNKALIEDNASQKENEELKKAIEEFEQTEGSVEKLAYKPYIKEIDTYRNMDGFKTDDLPEDILETLDTIEKNKKRTNSLTPIDEPDNQMVSYNYNADKYLLKNPMEDLTEEEEKALFDEDVTDEDETLSTQYYNNSDEIFIVENEESSSDDIFIIEDEETAEELESEDTEDSEEKTETKTEEPAIIESTEQEQEEPAPDVENLQLKIKYELSDDKGIALLKYHDITALIGYIGKEISVLKKFNTQMPEELSVRLSEQVDETTQHYIVKIGDYKGLVQVKPHLIRLLLNL